MPAPDQFHFDITPEQYEVLTQGESPLITPGANGYTIQATTVAPLVPRYHRHTKLQVGDSATFYLDFEGVLPGITELENNVTFSWSFYNRLGSNKVLMAQAKFWFPGPLTLGVHIVGVDTELASGVTLLGTENMAGAVKRGKHVLDASYGAVASGAVNYTVLQGNWYALGGHAQ